MEHSRPTKTARKYPQKNTIAAPRYKRSRIYKTLTSRYRTKNISKQMALSKATLTAVLALAFTVLSVHAAAPMSAPAPAPTAAAAGIYPSLGSPSCLSSLDMDSRSEGATWIFETGCGFEIYLAMRMNLNSLTTKLIGLSKGGSAR
ncbi:hypothetical protein SADUNF_Sadunf06G0185700 [Salix dunnii]|uniref:Uncharacterized protein n=1 Tax=Salix dunnii TaxID=1413687 RepID=A0A835K2D6_9ROSI|nr:hypothetical protein SADUNF_Sadunf06G0185700 [Salix dunnii]